LSKQHILDVAVTLSLRAGYHNLTRKAIADAAEVATGTVSYHFGAMEKLQNAVMREAVQKRYLLIVAQGLTNANWYAQHAPEELRKAAAKFLAA
jgi:AcrR family transcriptional regulator